MHLEIISYIDNLYIVLFKGINRFNNCLHENDGRYDLCFHRPLVH